MHHQAPPPFPPSLAAGGGRRLRPSWDQAAGGQVMEAVDYFVPGYWVFSKMVQNLADLGYDNNNLV